MTTLAFIGNIMLDGGVHATMRRVWPESVWGTALPLLRSADAVIGNLECAITSQQTPTTIVRRAFHFRADPVAADVLRTANVKCVSLANDHTLDFGDEGLFDTIDELDRAGIAHAGAGRTIGQAASPALVRLPGLTVGLVGLTEKEPAFAATAHAAGTHYAAIEEEPIPAASLARLASHCRERRADLAVLSLHWGPNVVPAPPSHFREFARVAIEAGFDIVHGHSAHMVQGVEMHQGRPILYDTGDIVDDYHIEQRPRVEWSFVFMVELAEPGRVERVRMIPIRLSEGAQLATGEDARMLCRRMIERCAVLGSRAKEVRGAAVIECSGVRATDDVLAAAGVV